MRQSPKRCHAQQTGDEDLKGKEEEAKKQEEAKKKEEGKKEGENNKPAGGIVVVVVPPVNPNPTPVVPTPVDPNPTPVNPNPTPVDPNPTPVDPTPVNPNPTPVDPNPTPVDPTPVNPNPTPVDPNPTPVDPTPVDPNPTPVDPTPVNPNPTPVDPNPTPVDPTPVNPNPTPVDPIPTPVDPGMSITANRPLVTRIDSNVQPATDWEFPESDVFEGREYWLFSTRNPRVLMTFDADGNYHPYRKPRCEGVSEDADSPCNVKPSNVAKECQRIGSKTLKAIMETDNEAAKLFNEIQRDYSTPTDGFKLFGWVNEAYSDLNHGAADSELSQTLFVWRGDKARVDARNCPSDFKDVSNTQWDYIKWVSSLNRTGVCKSPSLGQFVHFLKAVKACLVKNNTPAN